MKTKISILVYIFILFLSFSCNKNHNYIQNNNIHQINIEFLITSNQEKVNLLENYTYKLIFSDIDGDCTTCIVNLLEARNKIIHINEIAYIYLIKGDDLTIINYYLNLFNITLSNNELLIPDKNNEFQIFNQFHNGNQVIYLTDNKYNVLASSNIYDLSKVELYIKNNILKKEQVSYK